MKVEAAKALFCCSWIKKVTFCSFFLHKYNLNIFYNYCRPTTQLSCSTIRIVDFVTIVTQIGFFQKSSKWLIDTSGGLFRPKNFSTNYCHLNIWIVNLTTILNRIQFFFSNCSNFLISSSEHSFGT